MAVLAVAAQARISGGDLRRASLLRVSMPDRSGGDSNAQRKGNSCRVPAGFNLRGTAPCTTITKESSMIAFVFPGQGSQKRGMGQSLFDEVHEYAAVEREVDRILGYSMRKLCLED